MSDNRSDVAYVIDTQIGEIRDKEDAVTEDVDLIIDLLSQNNWDESLAASAFMAR